MNRVFTDIARMYMNQREMLYKKNLKIVNYPSYEMLYFQRELGCFY